MAYEDWGVEGLRRIIKEKEDQFCSIQRANLDDSRLDGLNAEIYALHDALTIAYERENPHSVSKKKSGCFITTAACHYKGLPDDCYELEVLRHFRDSYLLATGDGRNMVDHYYSVAPALAERLVEPSDLDQVWNAVTDCIIAIESGKPREAVATYKQMVLSLQGKLMGGHAA